MSEIVMIRHLKVKLLFEREMQKLRIHALLRLYDFNGRYVLLTNWYCAILEGA
jgi:hypothetical protein